MKKVLLVNEFHKLNTGYSNYGEALLWGLSDMKKYELAELACYASPKDVASTRVPWMVYPNVPGNEAQMQHYKSNSRNVFGEYSFEDVCLQFRPDVVIAFRDFWMDNFIGASPYRRFYAHILMPACDAVPQNEQWLNSYAETDACLSYSDWGANVLHKESGGRIKVLGSASPSALPNYKPMDTNQAKSFLGIPNNHKIIGTVMRNQRRKLYPDLFKGFREYLVSNNITDTYLYCHTSFPDHGWDIPYLLKEYCVSNRVLFTYICKNPRCGHIQGNFFSDAVKVCSECGQMSMAMPDVKKGLSHNEMAVVYNSFDLYVQYANSEGFGMPQVEAAACGVPVATINYSAMCDMPTRIEAYSMEPIALTKELETGCMRAVPNSAELVRVLKTHFSLSAEEQQKKKVRTRELFEKNFNIKDTVGRWANAIDSMPKKTSWESEDFDIFEPNLKVPKISDNVSFVKWCITNILGQPQKLGTFFESRLIRDLNYQFTFTGNPEVYFNEDSNGFSRPAFIEFDRQKCIEYLSHLRKKINMCESMRYESLYRK